MSPKWIMGIVLSNLICAIWSGIIEGSYLTSNTTSAMNSLINMQTLSWSDAASGITSLFILTSTILSALWQMFIWDYAQFTGDLIIVRFAFLAVSAGIIMTLVITLLARR
jgi:hypothetical protein